MMIHAGALQHGRHSLCRYMPVTGQIWKPLPASTVKAMGGEPQGLLT